MVGNSQLITRILKHPSYPNIDTGSSSPKRPSRFGPASTFSSSCELFDMLKALAAGKPKDEAILGDSGMDIESDDNSDASEPQSSLSEHESTFLIEATRDEALTVEGSSEGVQVNPFSQGGKESEGAKLAALSLSNVSSLDHQSPMAFDVGSLAQRLAASALPSREPTSPALTSPSTPSSLDEEAYRTFRAKYPDPSPAEKLRAIVQEFGDISILMQNEDGSPSPPEELIAATHGSLFKGVMLIGSLHLTTHRLLFHAMLPPDSALSGTDGSGASDGSTRNNVMHSGPVTIHKAGLQHARRVWMELGPEMVTTYPRADEVGRVRPLRCILTSTILRLEPHDPTRSLDLTLAYEGSAGHKKIMFSVDTEQSALQWRRAFETVLFRHARARWRAHRFKGDGDEQQSTDDWKTMRICVPLDRITIRGNQDYHSFSTLVSLDIELDDVFGVVWHPEDVVSGDYSGSDQPIIISHHDRKAATSNSSPSSLAKKVVKQNTVPKRVSSPHRGRTTEMDEPRSPGYLDTNVDLGIHTSLKDILRSRPETDSNKEVSGDSSYPFNVMVLNDQVWFVHKLESAVEQAKLRCYRPNAQRPRMVMDVGGYDCLQLDEEVTEHRQSSTSSEIEREEEMELKGGSAAVNARKLEKAALAAKVFGLREEDGIWMKRCYVAVGMVPARGHLIVNTRFLCFWRRASVGHDIKYRFNTGDVKSALECAGSRAAPHGLTLKIDGHHDVRFEFWQKEARDEAIRHIRAVVSENQSQQRPDPSSKVATPLETAQPVLGGGIYSEPSVAKIEHAADILAMPKEALSMAKTFPDQALSHIPFIANRPWKPNERIAPRTFAMLTIGSRGDVQPYIALGLRLKKDGHRVVIITHDEFKGWIEGYGIEHRQAGGDPTALMKLSEEHKIFSPGFFKESLGSYRTWLDDLLLDAWNACHDADVLIESPSAMAGIHIAEARRIPYFRAFTMPWTRTSAYPQAFMVPAFEMGPSFNYSTYVLFDNILWRATAGQVNRWRKKHLRLPPTDMPSLSITKVPFLYNFSSAVVPKPLDWHDDITITGYWTLEDSDTDWTPPEKLVSFMQQAREENRPLVYIWKGFGSIVVPDPLAMTKSIITAVEKADVRAIIAKGWSSRGGNPAVEGQEIDLPWYCYSLEKVPHAWLFPQVDAAMHHGGAGTVGASLRAGIPTLIKPWFGDQFFWANRVTKLEVGLKIGSLRSDELAEALTKATSDRIMIEKAKRIGELIRSENGVENAVNAIQHNIVRAAADRRKMSYKHR